jgi:DNA-binding CsgD family transcriptional regulator
VRLTVPDAETAGAHALATPAERVDAQVQRWALRYDGREYVLASSVVVGRGVGVDIQLDDDRVSRRHVKFHLSASGLEVEDLESRNGTWVNGRAIHQRTPLSPGDRVALGSCEFQLVHAHDAAAARVTQPFPDPSDTTPAPKDSPLAPLSPRERAVFPLLANGLSQREIASQCGVSVKTIETYRTRISHKLGLRSRAELIRFALETGVLRANTTRN